MSILFFWQYKELGDKEIVIRRVRGQKIRLEGFNNLTKSLSFNIYDLCYARSEKSQIEYLEYIDEEYDSRRLQKIVEEVTQIIDAKLVHVSTQDYDPRGASVVALVNEDHPVLQAKESLVVGHLDKSHITAHTYPNSTLEQDLQPLESTSMFPPAGLSAPCARFIHLLEVLILILSSWITE